MRIGWSLVAPSDNVEECRDKVPMERNARQASLARAAAAVQQHPPACLPGLPATACADTPADCLAVNYSVV